MSPEKYQKSRKKLGFKTVAEWIEKLGISKDTHKSFTSGRREVSPMVANHIQTIYELKKIKKEAI